MTFISHFLKKRCNFAQVKIADNMNNNRIFLVGYMGSGKSSVGRLLAKKTGWPFIDLDLFIENRYRKSVSQIFSENGETVFREMEQHILREVSLFEQAVISTGGGTPCFHNNMALMKQSGITIYLKVSIPELTKRLEASKHSRPLIKNKTKEDLAAFITENLKVREVFYNAADMILDIDTLLPPVTADGIATQLKYDLHNILLA